MVAKSHCMLTPQDASSGAVLTSATANIYTPGTVTPIPVTIYDKNGSTLSNPLTADATTGLVDFYLAVAQEVDLVVSKAGYTTRTFSNVPVIDDASLDLTALLTTTGDIPYAGTANAPTRLPIGSNGQILAAEGGIPAWGNTISTGGLVIAETTPGSTALISRGASATNGDNSFIAQNSTPTALLTVRDDGLTTVNVGGFAVLGGNVAVNGTVQAAEALIVNGTTNDSSKYEIYCQNSNPTVDFSIRNDGVILLGRSSGTMGMLGASAVGRQSITGAKAGNTAVASIVALLVAFGLGTDNTT